MSDDVATTDADLDDFDDLFESPAPGGNYPALAQLQDRLCIFEPQGTPEMLPDRFNAGKMKPRLTVNVTFLDGDTITHKVDKEGEKTELPEPVAPGTVMSGMFISQTKMVSQLKGRKMVLGRVIKLPKIAGSTNNRAWGITDVVAAAKGGDKQAQADMLTAKKHIAARDPFTGS